LHELGTAAREAMFGDADIVLEAGAHSIAIIQWWRYKKLQSEGKFDKAKGSAHNLAGDVKDAARDASKTADD
jgi:hypothetical protein